MKIKRRDTVFRKAIHAEARLAITLRYLASGESQQSLSYAYRVGRTTVCQIVSDTCDAIYESLKDPYLKTPASPQDWTEISNNFEEKWNFPYVIGALDGNISIFVFNAQNKQGLCIIIIKVTIVSYFWRHVTQTIVSRCSTLEVMVQIMIVGFY